MINPSNLLATNSGSNVVLTWTSSLPLGTNLVSSFTQPSDIATNTYTVTDTSPLGVYVGEVIFIQDAGYWTISAISGSPSTQIVITNTGFFDSNLSFSPASTVLPAGQYVIPAGDGALRGIPNGYNIYRDSTLIGTVDSGTLTFTDTTANPGTEYTWSVIAFGSCGLSQPDTYTLTTTCADVGEVAGIFAEQIDPTSVLVSWTVDFIADGYVLARSVNGGSYATILTATSTQSSYTDSGLVPGNSYNYSLYAFNLCGNSNTVYTPFQVVLTCDTIVGPPANVILTAVSETQISVYFNAITLPGGGHPTNYIIQRRILLGSYSTIATITDYTSQMPYLDSGLSPSTEYFYQIQATGGNCLDTSFSGEQSTNTLDAIDCGSPENTFSWTVPTFAEAGLTPTSTDDVLHISPGGFIDMSDPRITKVEFGPGSSLDDILILTKSTDSVIETWDGIPKHPQSFALPTPCILFAQTFGYYVNQSNSKYNQSSKKTLIQYNTDGSILHQIVLPYGNNDIANLSYDGSGNIVMQIFGIRGSISCNALNGTFTLTKISSSLYRDTVSGWSISRSGTPHTSGYIWGVYHGGNRYYQVDANTNITPPTDTSLYTRHKMGTCLSGQGPTGINYVDLENAGFVIRNFATGITKADLQSMGLIDSNGIFSYKFAHICCGTGNVNIDHLTCAGSDTICTLPPAPSALIVSNTDNTVYFSWTDNSSGVATTAIEVLNSITGIWDFVASAPPGVTTYNYKVENGTYAYRIYAVNNCGNSCYANYVSITVPCNCITIPTSIAVSFDSNACSGTVTGCSCFSLGDGDSATANVVTLEGPYYLTGDGSTMSWIGIGGFIEMQCNVSSNCSDLEPTLLTGPVNISVYINSSVLTVDVVFTESCCAGTTLIFHSTQNITCNGGLYVLDNLLNNQENCACEDTISWETFTSDAWENMTADQWETFQLDPNMTIGSFFGGTMRVFIDGNCDGPPPSPAPVNDSFNRGDSASLGTADSGQIWTQYSDFGGSIGIHGDMAQQNTSAQCWAIIYVGTNDVTVQATLGGTGSGFALVARTDTSHVGDSGTNVSANFYIPGGAGGTILYYTLTATDASGEYSSGLLSYISGTPLIGVCKMVVSGDNVYIYIDGSLVNSFVAVPHMPNGLYSGFFLDAQSLTVDNFSAS